MSEHSNEPVEEPPAARVPREYVQPQLVSYGSVAKLTQSMVGSQSDQGQGNRRSACL